MKAHTLNLHKQLPGTFLAKGMINDNNRNFIEECILQQNKINTQTTGLEIYKLHDALLHHSYTTTDSNGSKQTTTLLTEINNDPAIVQLDPTNFTTTEGKYIMVYHNNLRGRAMALFHKIQSRP